MPAKKSKTSRRRAKKSSSKTESVSVTAPAVPVTPQEPVVTEIAVVTTVSSDQPTVCTEAESLSTVDAAFNASYEELKQLMNATKMVLSETRRLHRQAKRDVKEAGKRRRRSNKSAVSVSI